MVCFVCEYNDVNMMVMGVCFVGLQLVIDLVVVFFVGVFEGGWYIFCIEKISVFEDEG